MTIPAGCWPSSYERILPFEGIRQIRPRLESVTQTAPSGPVVRSFGSANSAGSLYSVTRGEAVADEATAARQPISAAVRAAMILRRGSLFMQLGSRGRVVARIGETPGWW